MKKKLNNFFYRGEINLLQNLTMQNKKISQQCILCGKYLEVSIKDFLENKKSICNECMHKVLSR